MNHVITSPFLFRLICSHYLKDHKFTKTFSDDVGIAIFLSVIFFTVHLSGLALVFLIRRAKPIIHKATEIPQMTQENGGEFVEKKSKKKKRINSVHIV